MLDKVGLLHLRALYKAERFKLRHYPLDHWYAGTETAKLPSHQNEENPQWSIVCLAEPSPAFSALPPSPPRHSPASPYRVKHKARHRHQPPHAHSPKDFSGAPPQPPIRSKAPSTKTAAAPPSGTPSPIPPARPTTETPATSPTITTIATKKTSPS